MGKTQDAAQFWDIFTSGARSCCSAPLVERPPCHGDLGKEAPRWLLQCLCPLREWGTEDLSLGLPEPGKSSSHHTTIHNLSLRPKGKAGQPGF